MIFTIYEIDAGEQWDLPPNECVQQISVRNSDMKIIIVTTKTPEV